MEPIRRHDKRNLESIPVGSLGLIPLKGCENIGKEIDYYLTQWRAERESEHKNSLAFAGYQRPTYVVDCDLPRFGTGEGTCHRRDRRQGKTHHRYHAIPV